MNYLLLCQRTVRESGTISGDALPASVTGQSGRLLKVVEWVAEAWRQVQNLHDDWKWMRAEFTGTITAGAARYTPASFNLTRFSKWLCEPRSVTIYDTAKGVADESELKEMSWDDWRINFGRGVQQQNRPRVYAISPTGEFCLGPVPDVPYTVRGEYMKSAQDLTANTDIPELPDTSLHTVIVWKALLLLAQFDEGQWPTGVASVRCQDDLRSMQKYRPKITIGAGATIA